MRSPIADSALPTEGSRSFRYPRRTHVHQGVDVFVPLGTAVEASAAGVVEHANSEWVQGFSGYGRVVVVRHEDGTRALYGHLDDVRVSVGDELAQGDVLGTVGKSVFSDGVYVDDFKDDPPHLHFELANRRYPLVKGTPRLDPVSHEVVTVDQGGEVITRPSRIPKPARPRPTRSNTSRNDGVLLVAILGGLWLTTR